MVYGKNKLVKIPINRTEGTKIFLHYGMVLGMVLVSRFYNLTFRYGNGTGSGMAVTISGNFR